MTDSTHRALQRPLNRPKARGAVLPALLCALLLAGCSESGNAPVELPANDGSDPGSGDPSDGSGNPSDGDGHETNAGSGSQGAESGTGAGAGAGAGANPDSTGEPRNGVFPADRSDLAERVAIYQQDGYGEVDVIRVDVRTRTTPGTCTLEDDSGCTLADVIADTNRKDEFSVRIPAHFEATDYPEDGSITNVTLSQRGGTTRQAAQKSFKIRLNERDNLWRSERSLLLNKHPFEATRIRNKLAFDLMSQMPHTLSFRTQFVNLWIDDGQGPVDYGLFTHVEAPGKNYLDKRGLDRDDNLYKVGYFRFAKNDLRNVQVDAAGEPLDLEQFERSLEIESGKDHRMLVQMLEAMHDPERSFDSVLDEYFNRNNVLLWMTYNFLVHQTDAVTHNFLLYNPQGSKKFYFLPWDYDGGFVLESEPAADDMSNQALQRRLYYGYARGINSEFHSRYYKLPGTHEKILAAADMIRENWMTDTQVAERAALLETAVEPFVTRPPDIDNNPSYSPYSVASFARHVAGNHEALQTRFGIPMPPTLDKHTEFDEATDEWVFRWTPAYDVTGHSITYDLLVSTSKLFEPDDIVYRVEGLEDAPDRVEHRVPNSQFRSGEHFVRVIARASSDPQRYWQVADNDNVISGGVSWFGMVEFTVQ